MLGLKYPIIQAPMAGGVANPTLAAAVSNAGGLGFLAAGYKSVEQVAKEYHETKRLTDRAFGLNLFMPSREEMDGALLAAYRARIQSAASELGTVVGEPYDDDDGWEGKLRFIMKEKVEIVSFTFGCPSSDIIEALQRNGTYVIVTVTKMEEAWIAVKAGVDALCLQGIEAGGHQATFHNGNDNLQELSLLELIGQVRTEWDIPFIAAGGLMNAEAIRRVLAEGAMAAQLGTAFLLCPESGTNPVYREVLRSKRYKETAITRAFTGRRARGLVNGFMAAYTSVAPAAYPYVHQMTQPIRKENNPEYMSLWAGKGFQECRPLLAAELIRELMETN
ncbi:MAG: NAD(P)H-dependent flavin oxidoreductase [Bacillus sp. (in: firmicutes)]